MSTYYPLRRIPEAYSAWYFWRRVLPIMGSGAIAATQAAATDMLPEGTPGRSSLSERSRLSTERVVQRLQRRFFDLPGLDTLAVREMTKIGRTLTRAGRTYLSARIKLRMDRDGRARTALPLIPSRGYDQLMLTGLAIGTALGYFRGGRIHTHIWWDSERGEPQLRHGTTIPGVRRFDPPRTLADTAADIDDLYWADAHGQSIKITRVGTDANRRWIVSIPGTDHASLDSTPNVADLESNFREELNLPSSIRLGVIHLVNQAMLREGIPRDKRASEKVLLVGHSQGGMVAIALAATEPSKLGFSVEGVITLGSPARRIRVRTGVPVLAVEHDQDIVPSLDGTPRREADGRAVYHRKLVRPRKNPLFYAHASSTYTETVRQAEKRHGVAPWGKIGRTITELSKFLPADEEPTRVMHGYVWQDILTPTRRKTWDQYLSIGRTDWEPVTFGVEIEAALAGHGRPASDSNEVDHV